MIQRATRAALTAASMVLAAGAMSPARAQNMAPTQAQTLGQPAPALTVPPGTSAPASTPAMRPPPASIVAEPGTRAAPARPAARRVAARAPGPVTVVNARKIILGNLEISDAEGMVVGTVATPVAGGKSVRLALKGAKGCTYQVHAVFEDESEAEIEALDLCKDGRIRLTD